MVPVTDQVSLDGRGSHAVGCNLRPPELFPKECNACDLVRYVLIDLGENRERQSLLR